MVTILSDLLQIRACFRQAIKHLNVLLKSAAIFAVKDKDMAKPTCVDAFLLGDSIIDMPLGVKQKISVSQQETPLHRILRLEKA